MSGGIPVSSAEACWRQNTRIRKESGRARTHTHTDILTLALEGLQRGGVRGAQPGRVAPHNPLQVAGGVREEQI